MSFQVDPLLKDFIQLGGSHCTVWMVFFASEAAVVI